jgi:hypothetical protein
MNTDKTPSNLCYTCNYPSDICFCNEPAENVHDNGDEHADNCHCEECYRMQARREFRARTNNKRFSLPGIYADVNVSLPTNDDPFAA